jgi:peroxiredoxin
LDQGRPPDPASIRPERAESAAPFELAPAFRLERLDGGAIDLIALRGKTVVIDFWATWCVPCEAQVAELNAVYDSHKEADDVEVLGISIDTLGAQVVRDWVHDKGVRYPVLMGSMDLLQAYVADGDPGGVPLLVIVGPDGSIDSRHSGSITRSDLEAALARERG